jgi:hypothetical protein
VHFLTFLFISSSIVWLLTNDLSTSLKVFGEVKSMQKGVLSAGIIGLAAALTIGVGAVTADTNATTPSKLAQAIASKFNLNATDVQNVITQQHQQTQADRQMQMKSKLDQAVKDGKLTQDQENTLLQKLESMHQNEQNMRSAHQDLRQWMQNNKIDLRSILGEPKGGMRMGHMMGMEPGEGT